MLPADPPTTCRSLLSGAQGLVMRRRQGVQVVRLVDGDEDRAAAEVGRELEVLPLPLLLPAPLLPATLIRRELVARQLPEDVRNDEGRGERVPVRGPSAPRSAVAEQRPPPMRSRLKRTQRRYPDPSDAHAQHRAPCALAPARPQRLAALLLHW